MYRIIWIFLSWFVAVVGAAVYAAFITSEDPKAWRKVVAYVIYELLVCCLCTAFVLLHVELV